MNHSVNIDYNLDKTSSIRILHIGGNKSTYISAISNVNNILTPILEEGFLRGQVNSLLQSVELSGGGTASETAENGGTSHAAVNRN